MYPHPPPSHRPTNYYWILVGCTALMLGFLFAGLRGVSARLNAAAASPVSLSLPSAASRSSAGVALQISPTAAADAPASPVATPTPNEIIEVDPKTLTESPAAYRSRLIRVRGKVFYTGKLADGKTWVQIVGDNNVYVDGQLSDALPAGVVKGVEVEITGIGAGLTNITASNGQDYDQAYIDPIQSITVVK